jgi:hypothetical protein
VRANPQTKNSRTETIKSFEKLVANRERLTRIDLLRAYEEAGVHGIGFDDLIRKLNEAGHITFNSDRTYRSNFSKEPG